MKLEFTQKYKRMQESKNQQENERIIKRIINNILIYNNFNNSKINKIINELQEVEYFNFISHLIKENIIYNYELFIYYLLNNLNLICLNDPFLKPLVFNNKHKKFNDNFILIEL